MSVSPDMSEAKGHVARINRFDEATILFPMSQDEVTTLVSLLHQRMRVLKATNDYPELERDERLYANLLTGNWMLSQKPRGL